MIHPDYSGFTAAINAIRAAQSVWDNASPPEDPPECPDLTDQALMLVSGHESELVSQEAFLQEADEEICGSLDDMTWIAQLVVAGLQSSDQRIYALVRDKQAILESVANRMLEEAWEKENGRN